jgi:hypothetical protein
MRQTLPQALSAAVGRNWQLGAVSNQQTTERNNPAGQLTALYRNNSGHYVQEQQQTLQGRTGTLTL